MYRQFAPFVDTYLITEIKKSVPDADTYFDVSDLADMDKWKMDVLERGLADGVRDEADFTIRRFKSKFPDLAVSRRNAALVNYASRRGANKLALASRRLSAI